MEVFVVRCRLLLCLGLLNGTLLPPLLCKDMRGFANSNYRLLFAITTAFTIRLALQSRNDTTAVHAKTSGVQTHAEV